MNKRFSILLAFLLSVLGTMPIGAQTESDSAWDAAMAQYKADNLDDALKLFDVFRAGFPDNPKADDALWFIGRIHVKAGRPAEAERAFRSLMELPFRSNRYTEAAYDLSKLYVSLGRTEDAVGLLESVKRTKNLASEDRRVLRLLAELEADQAGVNRGDYRDADARAGLQRAVELYGLLLADPADANDLLDDSKALGAAWADLADAAEDFPAFEAAREKAVQAWRQALEAGAEGADAARLRTKIADMERGPAVGLTGTIEAFGGAAPVSIPSSSYTQWGAVGSADLALVLPLGWRQELRVGVSAGHDSFSLKTSGFTAAEQDAGAVRNIQRTNDLGASLGWHAGSRHGLHSELEASGTWELAEDLGDSSLGAALDERLDWRLVPELKLGLDLGLALRAWPDDLLVMSRELDRWEASANPKATWYPVPDLALDAGYAFTFRQYLNAVYAPDTVNKQYLIHEGAFGARWTPGTVVRLSADYKLTWNDTRYYTTTLFGPGALAVADFYDYVEHAGNLKLDLRFTSDFRAAASGGFSYQSFINYPARDAARNFTGNMRRDWNAGAKAEIDWRFWPAKENRFADLWAVIAADYTRNGSNNLWEDAIQTNYGKLEAFAGLRMELP